MGNIIEVNNSYDGIQLFFFSKRASLDFLSRYRPEYTGMGFKNIDPIIATIIADGKATLHELRTIYSLEDGMNLWEIIAITRYNEYQSMERAKKNKGR